MSSFNFPIFKTKNVSVSKGFNLADPVERREYFDLKAGEEIKKIRDFLKDKTFVAYLLGKKNSGKGTYTKLFMEAVGSENISHVSVGDIIRAANQDLLDSDKKDAITDFLSKLPWIYAFRKSDRGDSFKGYKNFDSYGDNSCFNKMGNQQIK